MNNNNNKIKICALSTISKTMDWFIVDNMRNLAKNGYDVTLVCNMDEGFEKRNSDYAKCIDLKMSRGVNPKDLITVPFKLRKIFKQNQFDIIYYITPNAAFYASIGGILAGVKKRVYSQAGLRYVSLSGVKRKIFKFIEKLTCEFSTDIRAQSPLNMKFAIEEKLCKKNKISVVGIGGTTGVDLSQCDNFDHDTARKKLREKYGIPLNSFVFGYVGRINKDKGINELLLAFKKLENKYNNICLVLVGMLDDTNPIQQENLRYAKEDPRVYMTGNIPSERIYQYMAMFDVLTHPTYREGFGKVLQEAMGMSLPIITTNVPGPSEVIENGKYGILVDAKSPDSLADGMRRMYENGSLRKLLAVEGRKRAEVYFDRPIMLNNLLVDINQIVLSIKE